MSLTHRPRYRPPIRPARNCWRRNRSHRDVEYQSRSWGCWLPDTLRRRSGHFFIGLKLNREIDLFPHQQIRAALGNLCAVPVVDTDEFDSLGNRGSLQTSETSLEKLVVPFLEPHIPADTVSVSTDVHATGRDSVPTYPPCRISRAYKEVEKPWSSADRSAKRFL